MGQTPGAYIPNTPRHLLKFVRENENPNTEEIELLIDEIEELEKVDLRPSRHEPRTILEIINLAKDEQKKMYKEKISDRRYKFCLLFTIIIIIITIVIISKTK